MTPTLSLKDPGNSYHSQSYGSFPSQNFKMRDDSEFVVDNKSSGGLTMTSSNNNSSDSVTPFEKLTYNLKNNSIYTKEIVLGKLIGFYRIGDEIGIGNFSKVKRGVHLLTKGNFKYTGSFF